MTGELTWLKAFLTLAFCLLQFFYFFCNLLIKVVESIGFHRLKCSRKRCDILQSGKNVSHRKRHVWAAIHSWPPAKASIAML